MSTLEQRSTSGTGVAPIDHFAGLRAQRREHFRNAVWWKQRYRAWGGDMELQWFLSEARSHRHVNRILWTMGAK